MRNSRRRIRRRVAVAAIVTVAGSACAAGHADVTTRAQTGVAAAGATSAATARGVSPVPVFVVSKNHRDPTATLRSRHFHVRTGERVVLLIASTNTTSHLHLTVHSGCGLHWSSIKTKRHHGELVKVWAATAKQPGSKCLVLATARHGLAAGEVTVLGFLDGGGIGARVGAKGSKSDPHSGLRPRFSQSAVYAVGVVRSPSGHLAAAVGSHVVRKYRSAQATYWVERQNAPTIVNARVTTGATNVAPAPWDLVTIEISPPRHCLQQLATCGYPSPSSTGVPATAHLTPSDSITAQRAGQVISDMQVNGTIVVTANDVTIKDTEVITSSPASFAVRISAGVTGTLIEDSTIHGQDNGANSVEYAIDNNGDATTTAVRVDLYYCTECYIGAGTLQDSYAIVNATVPGAHYEDTYYGGGADGSFTVSHDTLLNPQAQTAVVYTSDDSGPVTNVKIMNSVLAGGGYTIYGGGDSASNITVTNNRFAKVYYPASGHFGVDAYVPQGVDWSGNIWDESAAAVRV